MPIRSSSSILNSASASLLIEKTMPIWLAGGGGGSIFIMVEILFDSLNKQKSKTKKTMQYL